METNFIAKNTYIRRKQKTVSRTVLVFDLLTIILFLIYSNCLYGMDFVSAALLLINLIIWLFAYSVAKERFFSLYKTALFFILVFLILAPSSQLANSFECWGYSVGENVEHSSLLMVTIWLLSLLLCKVFVKSKHQKTKSKYQPKSTPLLLPLLLLLLIVDLLILQIFAGFQNLFSRGSFAFSAGTNFDIAIDFLLKTFPILGMILIKKDKKIYKKNLFAFSIFLIFSLLVNNPLANSRFLALSAMLGIFFILFPSFLKSKYIDFVILLSICVLFPLASQFKNSESVHLNEFNLSKVFLNVDFDAFSMIEQGIVYHHTFGSAWGKQMISSLFFFVPRNILPIKGTPSGEIVVNALHPGSFANVSFPFISEGMIDFGVIGAIFYVTILSILLIRLDQKFSRASAGNSVFYYLYPFFIGYLIYIMRGSLAPTILRLFGFLLPFILYHIVLFFFKPYRLDVKHETSIKKFY